MKVAICSSGVFDLSKHEDYVSITNRIKLEYCNKYDNIDFLWSNENMHIERDPHFARFSLLLYALSKGYDWAVWMDCDAAPVNFEKDISQWLMSYPNDKVIIQTDVLGLNSGVIAVPNNPKCIDWLLYLDSEDIYNKYKNSKWFDQDAIIDSLKEDCWSDLLIAPDKQFGFNHFENLYKWYDKENLKCPNAFKYGDFCLHIAGYPNTYRKVRFEAILNDIQHILCPVCESATNKYFSVPINKTHTGIETRPELIIEEPEEGCAYYKCPECGYIFSPTLGGFSNEDFREKIYNSQYDKIDPVTRTSKCSEVMFNSFDLPLRLRGERVLDFGGLYKDFPKLIEEKSHLWCDCVNLFFDEKPVFPDRDKKYTIMLCFDSLERTYHPHDVFALATMYLTHHGQLLIKTPVYDKNKECQIRTPENWSIIAPRCGVIAVHSTKTLAYLAARYGFIYKESISDENFSIFEKTSNAVFFN